MTSRQRRALTWTIGASIAATIAAVVRADDRALVFDVYLLFVGGLVLLVLVQATATALPRSGRSRLERALRPQSRPAARPEDLASLERRLTFATETAFEVHYRLRPVLRQIAQYRLSSHRGIELDDDPEEAREVLGPSAWELVRPDREPPADRLGPGHPLPDLRAAVDALERI
ncbi:MAG: hypothetical protein WD689_05015 [Gaiellaceae bacterium]